MSQLESFRLVWSAARGIAMAAGLVAAGCVTDADDGPDRTLGEPPAGDTVDRVEVGQYVGTWYEIASIPMGFQASCTATTATYAVVSPQTVSVVNRCRWGSLQGNPLEITGTATVVEPVSNARLEVDFGFALAPYWIVDLGVAVGDEPYPWAVVSNPDRSALWLLSRTPKISAARFDAVVGRLADRGFEPERMLRTEQP